MTSKEGGVFCFFVNSISVITCICKRRKVTVVAILLVMMFIHRSLSTSRGLKYYKLFAQGSNSKCVVNYPGSTFEVVTDNPKFSGGTNTGPQPIDLLLASLVGCEQITAMYVARHMNIKIDRIEFEVEAFRDQAGALTLPIGNAEPTMPVSRLQRIFGRAIVSTDASQEQLNLLEEEVVKRCPVANMVTASGCILDIKWEKVSNNAGDFSS